MSIRKNEYVVNIIAVLLLLAFSVILFFNYRNYADFSSIIILVSLIGLFFAITVFKFEYGILAFVFFIPLYHVIGRFYGISRFLTIFSMFLGIFIGALVYYIKKRQSLIKLDLRISKPVLFFIALATISFIFVYIRIYDYVSFYEHTFRDFILSVNQISSNQAFNLSSYQYINYFCGFLFLFLVTKIDYSKTFMTRFFFTLFSSTTIVFLALIHQVIVNPYFMGQAKWIDNDAWIAENTFANRYASTLVDPNSLGIFSIIMLLAFIGFTFYFRDRLKRSFGAIAILISFTLMMLSGSRTALLGLVVIILFYLFLLVRFLIKKIFKSRSFSDKQINWISTGSLVLIIIVIFILSILILRSLDDSLLPTTLRRLKYDIVSLTSGGFQESIAAILGGRVSLWKTALYIIREYPIGGIGIGMITVELPNYGVLFSVPNLVRDMANNYYLQVLAEMGIFVLIVNLWIYWEVIRKFRRDLPLIKNREKRNYLTGIFMILPVMLIMFVSGPHTYFMEISLLFYMFLGIVISFGSKREPINKNST